MKENFRYPSVVISVYDRTMVGTRSGKRSSLTQLTRDAALKGSDPGSDESDDAAVEDGISNTADNPDDDFGVQLKYLNHCLKTTSIYLQKLQVYVQ